MNVELEIKVIEKFIKKEKQKRYIQFISSAKQRSKFIKKLSRFEDFNFETLEEVMGSITQFILSKIEKLRVDTSQCYVISENSRLDKQLIDTKSALQEIIGYGMGTIVVFGNADMIYYEGEEVKNRFISK